MERGGAAVLGRAAYHLIDILVVPAEELLVRGNRGWARDAEKVSQRIVLASIAEIFVKSLTDFELKVRLHGQIAAIEHLPDDCTLEDAVPR